MKEQDTSSTDFGDDIFDLGGEKIGHLCHVCAQDGDDTEDGIIQPATEIERCYRCGETR